ncbi:MAG: hypothetical protein OXG35_05545 [Acidobacteria bacterium]|nr:hypothetical protein [Acidobacteriota bacterium]
MTAAALQASAERATDDVGPPAPGPLARGLEHLDLGSCGQCRRLANFVRVLDESAGWTERELVAEKQAHATTRTDLEARLKQRDARIGELEWLVPLWAWL